MRGKPLNGMRVASHWLRASEFIERVGVPDGQVPLYILRENYREVREGVSY